ncbi:hypothetical protein ACNTMW_10720 [Planosporangium sp. 12N6]|uniref:hypothetical protein n=1 Tax=Planosporangium spinosum TaxID=3402278 RepID=UPI003CFA2EDF
MVLILESRSHLDLGDLPNMLAAELGVMTVRLERAVRSLDGVARVHVNRWGDGAAHLHLWFLARPYGHLQLRGTFLSLWDEILPPIPEHQWRENLALVAAWLAEFGGRPLAEPPRIDWKAPATLASDSLPVPDGDDGAGSPAEGALMAGSDVLDMDSDTDGGPNTTGDAAASRADGGDGDKAAGTASLAAIGTLAADSSGVTGAGVSESRTGASDDATDSGGSGGTTAVTPLTLSGRAVDADEILVIPGPAGFPPIGDGTVRRTSREPAGPIPGQRDSSADSQESASRTQT